MALNSSCSICGTCYDSQTQSHQVGKDCVPILSQSLVRLDDAIRRIGLEAQVLNLANEQSFVNLKALIDKLASRHEALAVRVNLLEHPKMEGKMRKA